MKTTFVGWFGLLCLGSAGALLSGGCKSVETAETATSTATATSTTSGGGGGAGGSTSTGGLGCETACATGEACVNGACKPECGALTSCSGTCRDTKVDPKNCGACNASCAVGELCSEGTCCGQSELSCGGKCLDVAQNPENCGACGVVCGENKACVAGACVSACPQNFKLIGGSCASVVAGTVAGFTAEPGGEIQDCDANSIFFTNTQGPSRLSWVDPGGLGTPKSVLVEFESGGDCHKLFQASTLVDANLNGGVAVQFDTKGTVTDCVCGPDPFSSKGIVQILFDPKDLFLGHPNSVRLMALEMYGLHLGILLEGALFRVTVTY